MATACYSALPAGPVAARPRSLRLALSGAATASRPSALARLAEQLRQLKHFKVWDAPTASASERQQPAARGGRQAAPARQHAPVDGCARPGAAGGRRPGIVWFRGDLRLHDHEALVRAQAECSSLLPVYCFDPRDYCKSAQGYDKTGPYRAQFLTEAVADLRAALRALGSELVVRCGRPEEVLADLARRSGAGAVYCHSEVTYEELQVEAAVKRAVEGAGARLHALWSGTLCHLEDLPFKLAQLPQNFDKFRERVEGAAVRAALPAPTELRGLPLGGRVDPGEVPTLQQLGLTPLPAGCSSRGGSGVKGAAASAGSRAAGAAAVASDGANARGGEGEALRQLRRFVAQVQRACGSSGGGSGGKGRLPTSGAAYGSNFASSVAPWLATGCLSPRRMLEDVQSALAGAAGAAGAVATSAPAPPAGAKQDPLTWVRFELLWRDFFRFLTLRYSSMTAGQLGTSGQPAKAAQAQPAVAAV